MRAVPWVTVAIVAGFLVGFGLGASTRKQASKAISANVESGVIDVQIDTYQMLREGAVNFLDSLS